MIFKKKIVSISAIILALGVFAVALTFAFSTAQFSITNNIGFDVSGDIGATIGFSCEHTITGGNVTAGANVTMTGDGVSNNVLTINPSASAGTYSASITNLNFTAVNQTITYTFTITNTNADKDFTVTESHTPGNSNYEITCSYNNSSKVTLSTTSTSYVTITYTIKLLSEDTPGTFSPAISFTLA